VAEERFLSGGKTKAFEAFVEEVGAVGDGRFEFSDEFIGGGGGL